MVDIKKLLKLGGLFHENAKASVKDVLESVLEKVIFPDEIKKEDVLKALLEREELMSTGIGNGIAFPHPRNPVIQNALHERVVLVYMNTPQEWQSLDRQPVSVFFIIISSCAKNHVQIMSQLAFLCHNNDFKRSLYDKVDLDKIIDLADSII